MNTIQIKCYLFSNANVSVSSKNQSEIRIFNLAFNCWNGIFASLNQKIRSAYESLLIKGEEIKTYWQDEEEELICFSSDDELHYAINIYKTINQKAIRKKTSAPSASNQFLRIYIARKNPTSEQNSTKLTTKNEIKSPKKACNECDVCLIGETFKCNNCTEYRLCDLCQKRGYHKGHTFSKEKLNQSADKPGSTRPFTLCPKKLSNVLATASQSVPIVKNDEQLKFAGEVLKKILDPLDINVAFCNDILNKSLRPPMIKLPTKEISFVNTDPDQLKKIGENIRGFLDTRGIDAAYSIQNSICCNWCNEQIIGNRYKCTQCVDYDLCEKCEKKGFHKEHSMVKVAKKSERNKEPQMNNIKYCFSCNDPIIGNRFKCNTCLNHEICEHCEKKGLQRPHLFKKVNNIPELITESESTEKNNKEIAVISKDDQTNKSILSRNQDRRIKITDDRNGKAPTPLNVKFDSRNSATPSVRFKFSSRLSYNFTENKDNRVISRSQSRLEASSSIEEIRANNNNRNSPYSEYYEKNLKSKSVFSSSSSNLSTGTLSPVQSDLVVDENFSLIRSSSKISLNPKRNYLNQKSDLKVLNLQTSKGTHTPASRNRYYKGDKQIVSNNKENESVYDSDYENYSKKSQRDHLNISSFSSDLNSIYSSAFDSDIDIDKELKILDTIDRLRSMGYAGQWVKRLVNAKNGNFNQVLDSIQQRPVGYWTHHDPRKMNYQTNSYRL